MMRYLCLTMENFLVFKDVQTVRFPAADGVVVVYGDNGKGKTTLLNAFRFAFTGFARRRGNRPVSAAALPNKEAVTANGGHVPCRVTLEFTVDTDLYELTRRVVSDAQGGLTTEVLLAKNNEMLTRSDAEQTIVELMPPEVEQCFHFDGELLDQYEQLVEPDSAAGAQLKDSIEAILGVPILVNAERDARHAADVAGKELEKAAKADNRTKELGNALGTVNVVVEQLQRNVSAEHQRVLDLETRQRAVQEDIAEQGNKLELLARHDNQANLARQYASDAAVARESFAAALPATWKAVLVEPMRERLAREEAGYLEDLDTFRAAAVSEAVRSAFADRDEASCPVCEQPTEEKARRHIHAAFDHGDGTEDLIAQIQGSFERAKILRRSLDETARASIKAAEDTYRLALTRLSDAKDDLRELEDRLLDSSQDDLRSLARQASELGAQLAKARETLSEQQQELKDRQTSAEALRDQIRKAGGVSVDPAIQAASEVANRLADLFRDATAAYRESLKESVQAKATDIFTRMRSEASFRQLAINDSFGLQIVDPDGNIVALRSAGYEHLVALAQVGALQASSPVSGPIVMDSPFGRLDPQHVDAVVQNLNLLTSQVVLLAHEGEITSDEAHSLLGDQLLAEYELVRESHYSTRIVEMRNT